MNKFATVKHSWFKCGALILLTLGLAVPVSAEESFQTSRRLAEFVPQSGDVYLRTVNGQYDLYFPVPQRIEVDTLELELHFTNSIALEKPRSVFQLKVNDRTVTQFYLDKHNPENSLRVRLPKEALKVGFNRIGFEVTQHYARSRDDQHVCEDSTAPELWTQIDMWRSKLHLTGSYRSLPLTLAELDILFDRRGWQDQKLVILAPEQAVDENLLQWGSVVSQAVGLRIDYRPVTVRLATLAPPSWQDTTQPQGTRFVGVQNQMQDADGVLIGTKAQLLPFFTDAESFAINGPYLGLFPVSPGASRYLLVISGQDAAEVGVAVNALLQKGAPLPHSTHMQVTRTEFDTSLIWAEPYLASEGQYQFRDLGFRTSSVQGTYVQAKLLNFRLPADMRALESADVKLFLNMAYGASAREDSVLNLYVNDVFERAIPLNDNEGAAIRNYQINVPARSFQPGLNRIALEPRLIPLITSECLLEHDENLKFAIFDDSRIQMPKFNHYVQMPDLKLLTRSGFPHVDVSRSVPATLQVTDLTPDTISAAWTLAAKLAQVSKRPLGELKMSTQLSAASQSLLVVGTRENLGDKLLEDNPLFSKSGVVTASPQPPQVGASDSGSWRLFSKQKELSRETARTLVQYSAENWGVGDALFIQQYAKPSGLSEPTPVTLFFSESPQALYQNMKMLVESENWSKIEGDFTQFRAEPTSLIHFRISEPYHLGERLKPSALEYFMSTYPVRWMIGILLLILGLAWVTARLLRSGS